MITPTVMTKPDGTSRTLIYDGTVTMLKTAHPERNFISYREIIKALVQVGRDFHFAAVDGFLRESNLSEDLMEALTAEADAWAAAGTELSESMKKAVADLEELQTHFERAELEQERVPDLQALCRQRNIPYTTKLRKPALIDLLLGES